MTDSKMRELLPTEVITVKPGGFIQHPTCQVHELIRILKSNAGHQLGALLSGDGLECLALCFGAEDWQPGRLKLVIKFEPDPSDSENQESSLDELRRLAGS
jgi:hypothetical protein